MTGEEIGKLMADSIEDGIWQGISILLNGVKEAIIQNPWIFVLLLGMIVVSIVLGNGKKKSHRRK